MNFFNRIKSIKVNTSGLSTILLAIAAAISYSCMNFCIKLTKHDANQALIGLVRFFISWLWVASIVNYRVQQQLRDNHNISPTATTLSPRQHSQYDQRSQHSRYWQQLRNTYLHTAHIGGYLVRALFTALAVVSSCIALKKTSIASAMSLIMSQALFAPILEAFFCQRRLKISTLLSIIIGFSGVVVTFNPNCKQLLNYDSLYGLLSAFSIAVSYISLRSLTAFDPPYTIMSIHFSLVLMMYVVLLIFNFQLPLQATTWLWLSLVGVFGYAYQEFITRAMKAGSVSMVSTLQYSSIIISGLLGWLICGEIPYPHTYLGAGLIVIGSILTVRSTTKQVGRLNI